MTMMSYHSTLSKCWKYFTFFLCFLVPLLVQESLAACKDKSNIEVDDGSSKTTYNCRELMRRYSPGWVCDHDALSSYCCKSCADYAANPCLVGDLPYFKMGDITWNCSSAVKVFGEKWICDDEQLSSFCCQSCANYDPSVCNDREELNMTVNDVYYDDCTSYIHDFGMTQVCQEGLMFLDLCCQSCKAYDPDECVDEPRFYYHRPISCPEVQYWYGPSICDDTLVSKTCCATCASIASG